ncbi:hypothetical protein AB836_00235 [Rickettsiales bacterium (ex Bugula neritina AB1)]|nr:hypothetical protein AB836_00235 [Rickettsiales bacterium (ex Bugula neritina AB1)]
MKLNKKYLLLLIFQVCELVQLENINNNLKQQPQNIFKKIYDEKSTKKDDLKMIFKYYEPMYKTTRVFCVSFAKIFLLLQIFSFISYIKNFLFPFQIEIFDSFSRLYIDNIITTMLLVTIINMLWECVKYYINHYTNYSLEKKFKKFISEDYILKFLYNALKKSNFINGISMGYAGIILQFFQISIKLFLSYFIYYFIPFTYLKSILKNNIEFLTSYILFLAILSIILLFIKNYNSLKNPETTNKTFIGKWVYFLSTINLTHIVIRNIPYVLLSIPIDIVLQILPSWVSAILSFSRVFIISFFINIEVVKKVINYVIKFISSIFYKISCLNIWKWKYFYYFNYKEEFLEEYDIVKKNFDNECYGQMLRYINNNKDDLKKSSEIEEILSLIGIYNTNNNNYSSLKKEIQQIFFPKMSFDALCNIEKYYKTKQIDNISLQELIIFIHNVIDNYLVMMPKYYLNEKNLKNFFEEFKKISMPDGVYFTEIQDINLYVENSIRSLNEIKKIDAMFLDYNIYKEELTKMVNDKKRVKEIKKTISYFDNLKILIENKSNKFYWRDYVLGLNSIEVNKEDKIKISNNEVKLTRITKKKIITFTIFLAFIHNIIPYGKRKYLDYKIQKKILEMSIKKNK